MTRICEELKNKLHNSVPCHPKMNGGVKAANKIIKRILEKLPFALLAYRTIVRTSIGATSYLLVYEMMLVVCIELKISYVLSPTFNRNYI